MAMLGAQRKKNAAVSGKNGYSDGGGLLG